MNSNPNDNPSSVPGPTNAANADTNPARRQFAEQLTHALAQFTGTEGYYRYWIGHLLLTDGVKYLADHAGCYWLLDAIGSYQSELAKRPDPRLQEMQFWKLQVKPDKSALLTCVANANEPPAIAQQLEFTDCPLPEVQVWVSAYDGQRVALLPSEY